MFQHTSSEEINLWTTTEIQIYGMELKVKFNLFWLILKYSACNIKSLLPYPTGIIAIHYCCTAVHRDKSPTNSLKQSALLKGLFENFADFKGEKCNFPPPPHHSMFELHVGNGKHLNFEGREEGCRLFCSPKYPIWRHCHNNFTADCRRLGCHLPDGFF